MPSSKSNNKPKPKAPIKNLQIFSFEAIGTLWNIRIFDEIDTDTADSIINKIRDRIDEFDRNYSRFRDDSLVTAMSQRAGVYTLPDDATDLLNFYKTLYDLTGGQLTPLVGQLLSDAGYDANYSLTPKGLQQVPDWEVAMDYQAPKLTIKEPVLLDFGAAGKGYLVDIIARLLEAEGIRQYSINAGGDIYNQELPADVATIGLEHPLQTDQAIGLVNLPSGSICCSAGNRRKWAQYHHLINPSTKQSPNHLLSVWVVADDTLLADGLATALYFVEPAQLQPYFQFEYAIVKQDLSLEYSSNFPGTFFSGEEVGDV